MTDKYSIQVFDSISKKAVELDDKIASKGIGDVIKFLKHMVSILEHAKDFELTEITMKLGVKGTLIVVEADGAITLKFTKSKS
ncbi:MAG: hypothetical protein ACW98Y_20790 [Candidatus Thorarchaeota archaeon]